MLVHPLRFDRLGIPDRLDQLDRVVLPGRIPDIRSMTEVLDLVAGDDRILNYARSHARDLKNKVLALK